MTKHSPRIADRTTAVTPSAHEAGWRPDIQGLRALAVLLVIGYHADLPIPGGFVGVDIFFVISGYVITLLLLRQFEKGSGYRLRNFWAGRIRRILPALATVVMATLVLSALLEDPSGAQQQTGKTAIAALIMVSNIFLERTGTNYFLEPTYVNPLLNTWSLGVEEQFYLLFPIVLLVAFVWPRRGSRIFISVLSITIVASFALSVFMTFAPTSLPFIPDAQSFAFYSVTTRSWQFAVGSLLAVTATFGRTFASKWRHALGGAGLAAVVLAALLLSADDPYPGVAALLPTLGAAGLLAAGMGGSWFGTSILESRLGLFIGDRSYSLYLWHWPLLVFAGILFADGALGVFVALIATMTLAMATYRWVENPFRYARNRRASTFGALSLIAIGLVLSLIFAQAVKYGWGQQWTLGAHQAMQRDCDNPPFDPSRCLWDSGGDGPLVLVVGDSQAWASGDAVIDVAAGLGGSTVISAFNNCPFTAGIDPPSETCGAWQSDVLDYIRDRQPDAVIVANAIYGEATNAKSVNRIMTQISDLGPTPIVLLNPPGAGDQTRKSLVLAPEPTRSGAPSTGQFTSGELAQLRSKWGQDAVIDPTEVLCNATGCAIAKDGVEYYTDGNHLSVNGAAQLKPLFSSALSS